MNRSTLVPQGMERSLAWDAQSYWIDGQRRFLVCGEFHYFRVPQPDWRRRLALWRDAGGNTVATYVPWLIHEPEEGQFLFGPEPWRQVEAFLQACQEEGLFVLVRPGPYQYSELVGGGIPPWFFLKHPQALALDAAGKPRNASSVSYLHPVFLDKVRAWFDQVCPRLAAHTMTRGGPIALVQFDNELMGIHEWHGGWDYNPEAMGFGREEGRYPAYLRGKYPTLAALNDAYETRFDSFAGVTPIEGQCHTDCAKRRRVRDYMLFYFETVAEYAQILISMLHARGLILPFVHNAANPRMTAYFKPLMDRSNGAVLLGSDHYYNLNQNWEQNNPTPQYAVKCFTSLQMLSMMKCPPTVFEMPGGSASDWPPITAIDLDAAYRLHAALGMKGLNYYIFTGGYNPPGAGVTSDVYDYQAAVGPDGDIRPPYQTQKAFAAFLHANSWLTQAWPIVDFRVGFDWNHAWGDNFFAQRCGNEFTPADAWNYVRKGLLPSAFCGSWSAEMCDLSCDEWLGCQDKPLWVPTSTCMARDIQQRLVRHVLSGGSLILAPVIPTLDEEFQPCSILSTFLGGATTRLFSAWPRRLNAGEIQNICITDPLYESVCRPSAAEGLAIETNSQAEIGWLLRFSAGGRVVWLGFPWKHTVHEHSRLMTKILSLCGCRQPAVSCSNPNVWTFLRTDGKQRMLFLVNLFTSAMECSVRVDDRQSAPYDTGVRTIHPMRVDAIRLPG